VSDSCKCRPISVKRNIKVEANVVVSECTLCYRDVLVKLYVIIFTIYFGAWVFLHLKHPSSRALVFYTLGL